MVGIPSGKRIEPFNGVARTYEGYLLEMIDKEKGFQNGPLLYPTHPAL